MLQIKGEGTAKRRVPSLVVMLLVTSIMWTGLGVRLTASNPSGISPVDSQAGSQESSSRVLPAAEALGTLESVRPTQMNGMTINAWSAEAYNSSDFDQSISNLANTGANWVTLTVFWFMNTTSSTEMQRRPDLYTASDSSLIHAIQKAHELNREVVLKPMVDVVGGSWRGQISPSNWTLWFGNYRNFTDYYADLAHTNNVELFTVGTELRSSQSQESEWRHVISDVRTRFSGNITYAANWDSYSSYSRLPQYAVKFWDALDYVGVDGYFPLTNSSNPTIGQLVGNWSYSNASGWWGTGLNWTGELYSTYSSTGKKIVFTEAGYTSQNGTNTQPWTSFPLPHDIDLQEQADCYQACLEVFKDKTWFAGWFWWDWQTNPNGGGPTDQDYTPQNKPAQSILTQYYSARTVTFQAAGTGAPATLNYTRATGNYSVPGSLTMPAGSSNSITVPSGSNVSFIYPSPIAGDSGTRYVLASANSSSPLTNVTSDTTVTGQYTTQYSVTFSQVGISPGLAPAVVTIDGAGYPVDALPASFWWDNGSSHTFAFNSPLLVTANNKKYAWTSTAGLSTLQSGSIIASGSGNVIGNYKTQYLLMISTDPGALAPQPTRVPPGEAGQANSWWYEYSTNVTLTAQAVSGFAFSYWVVDGANQSAGVNSTAITMSAPHTATAHYATLLSVNLLSPQNNTRYSGSIPLTFEISKPALWMGYSLDGQANVTVTGNTTLNVPDGSHRIVMYATATGESASSQTIYFSANSSPYDLWRTSFISPGGYPIVGFANANAKLYAAANSTLCVYDGSSWDTINAPTPLTSLESYEGTLVLGGKGGLYSYDGTAISLVFAVPTYIKTLGVYNGTLYAGTMLSNPPILYRCNGSPKNQGSWHVDTEFSALLNSSGSHGSIDSFAVYNNTMYLSSGDRICCYDGTVWRIANIGYEYAEAYLDMAIYDGKLFLATRDKSSRELLYLGGSGFSGSIIEYDGTNWTTLLGHDYWIYSLETYNDELYVGTANKIYVYDGTSWSVSFYSPVGAYYATRMTVFNNTLYAGMGNGYILADEP